MEVKKGYKQTELGVIPEDWDISKIGNLLEFKNGLNKGSEFFGYGTPIINYMDVFRYNGIKVSDVKGKVFLNSQEKNSFSAKKGDVFFTRTSEIPEEIGMASVLLEEIPDCVFSGFILRGRPKNNKITSEYFQYCLVPSYVRRQIISTSSYTTRALTNGRYLSNVKLLFPSSLPEQKAIATALSDMDALIAQTEKLIEKKKAMKQGMMQELLKPKKGWVTKKLGEIFEYEQPSKYIVTETTYNPFNEIPVLTAGKSFVLGYTSETFGVFQQIPVIIFDDFTTSCQYVDFKFKVKSSAIKILKPASIGINLPLAYELLKNIDYQVGDHKRHWIGEFINFEILIPSSPEEQNRIGRIIEDLLNEIAFYQSKLQKLKLQKQGMMQELLTGRIRLL